MVKVGFVGWRGMVGSVLMDRMNAEHDFQGFDMLLFINLSDSSLKYPTLGIGADDLGELFATSLQKGGYMAQEYEILYELKPFEIWATLIPEDISFILAGAEGTIALSPFNLVNGKWMYINSRIQLPGILMLLLDETH